MERPHQLTAESTRSWDRPLIVVPIFVLMSLIGGTLPSFSIGANMYVLITGGGMFWFGLTDRVAKRPVPVRLNRAVAWWLVPGGLLVGMELMNFAAGSTYAHPTLSALADPVLEGYPARSLAYFAWLSGFWGLVRR